MEFFGQLTKIFIGVAIGSVVIGLIIFGVIFYAKKHKPGKEKEDTTNYSNFKRVNSKDYLPFDDIRDDIIIMDKFTRFVAGVVCRGYDFFSAHPAEQLVTQQGYLEFVNTIEKPIQKRIFSRRVDLEGPINRHKEAIEKCKHSLLTMYSEGVVIENQLKDASEESKLYLKQAADSLYESIKRMEWKKRHLEHLIEYMENLSGEGASPTQEESYIFDWVFNPGDFPDDITQEEIFIRAQKELDAKTSQIKASLKSSGVRVRRADERELIDMVRRHFHPWGVDIFKMSDVENSNFDELVVSSKSLEDAEKRYFDVVREEVMINYRNGLIDVEQPENEMGGGGE